MVPDCLSVFSASSWSPLVKREDPLAEMARRASLAASALLLPAPLPSLSDASIASEAKRGPLSGERALSEEPAVAERSEKAKKLKSAQKKKITRKSCSRKVLKDNQTPSLYDVANHHCSFNRESTLTKVWMRFWHSFNHLVAAYGLECDFPRGPTYLNGARSKCGHCQAAHAALSPALADDMLARISNELREKPFPALSALHQSYLEKRFALTNEDRIALSEEAPDKRIERMDKIMARLTEEEKKATFYGTKFEEDRNATYENLTAGNRIDCFLENYLRSLEDELVKKCMNSELTPKKALEKLYEKYESLLQDCLLRLNQDRKLISHLQTSWNDLCLSHERLLNALKKEKLFVPAREEAGDVFEACATPEVHQKNIAAYLEAFSARFNAAGDGVPRFDSFEKQLKQKMPFGLLRKLARTPPEDFETEFLLHNSLLKADEGVISEFASAIAETENRVLEIETQLEVFENGFGHIHEFINRTFNQRDEYGLPRTPTKDELTSYILSHIKTVTPNRLDLDPRKRRLFIGGAENRENREVSAVDSAALARSSRRSKNEGVGPNSKSEDREVPQKRLLF